MSSSSVSSRPAADEKSLDAPAEKRLKEHSSHVGELGDVEGPAEDAGKRDEAAKEKPQGPEAILEKSQRLAASFMTVETSQVSPGSFPTADGYFAQLCKARAIGFAVGEAAKEPIWVCNREDKVIEVYQGMIRRNISSVPVLLRESGRWFGILDLMDICRYVILHFGGAKFSPDLSFWDLVAQEGEFAKKTVAELMVYPVSSRNPFHPVLANYSAFACVEALAKENNLHRIPVLDNLTDKKLVNLITESQCVREAFKLLPALGEKANKTLSSCPAFFKPVLMVTEDTIAIDAFNLMVLKNVQGVAVVDEATGKLRGNLSLRDLKAIGGDASLFWRLHQTVKNFLLKVRHEYQTKHKRPRRPIYVLPTATIRDVIEALHKYEVHRVYIVDSHHDKRPVGVVAIKDILLENIQP